MVSFCKEVDPCEIWKNTCRVAVVQATPVMFRKDKCLEKALRLIDEAAGEGAELIVFPELFIPGYPYGMTFGFTVAAARPWAARTGRCTTTTPLLADGPEMRKFLRRARELGVYISMGYSERDAVTGTLYNANMMISPEGEALNHRKLKPTGSERVVWGDAPGLLPCDGHAPKFAPWAISSAGRAICPLPGWRCTRRGYPCTSPPIPTTIRSGRTPSATSPSRVTATSSTPIWSSAAATIPRPSAAPPRSRLPDIACRGGSCVIDPFGHEASVTVWDKEDIIYADLDMQKVPRQPYGAGLRGHYARPDVLELRVNEK